MRAIRKAPAAAPIPVLSIEIPGRIRPETAPPAPITAAPAVAKGIRPPELVSPLLAGVFEADLGEGVAF